MISSARSKQISRFFVLSRNLDCPFFPIENDARRKGRPEIVPKKTPFFRVMEAFFDRVNI
jgi:hypothetical protein